MMTKNTARTKRQSGFTMIELLTVIAIIAILAAILFPIFGTIREQARQSSTMSNMQSIYQGMRLYYEDEQRYPTSLFGYAQVMNNGVREFALPTSPSASVLPMDQATTLNPLYPYLFREQIKDLPAFSSGNEVVTNRAETTIAYYPPNSPLGAASVINNGVLTNGVPVEQTDSSGACTFHGDPDLPNPNYAERAKIFYKMDAMDIGPMIDQNGVWVKDSAGNRVYALHYTPDWTRLSGAACDINNNGQPYVAQLKYKNPPTERTIIKYNTHHAAIGNSGRVIALFLSGTAKKIDLRTGINSFPLNYQ
jgi:prepilin-type N-terminal cleavage/methylation domain-containing protein